MVISHARVGLVKIKKNNQIFYFYIELRNFEIDLTLIGQVIPAYNMLPQSDMGSFFELNFFNSPVRSYLKGKIRQNLKTWRLKLTKIIFKWISTYKISTFLVHHGGSDKNGPERANTFK